VWAVVKTEIFWLRTEDAAPTGWGIFGLGFYKDVAPTALGKCSGSFLLLAWIAGHTPSLSNNLLAIPPHRQGQSLENAPMPSAFWQSCWLVVVVIDEIKIRLRNKSETLEHFCARRKQGAYSLSVPDHS